jgi:aromatic-L-amino-acid decarboxylase
VAVNLEPDPTAMRALGQAALDLAVGFVEARGEAPAADLDGAFALGRALAAAAMPEHPRPPHEVLAEIREAAAKGLDTAGPGYLAFIPGGGLFTAAVADLLADVTNRFVNLAAPAPAFVGIETAVVRWLCDLFALPGGAQGILTSGGSMANFSAIVTARTARCGDDFGDATLYVTDHVHQSVTKAARLAGFSPAAVRVVPCRADLSMDPDGLRDAVRADRRAGRRPFLVVASAGTTNTGAVDPLPEVADVAATEELWFHADAAYGGFFWLTERGRARLAGLERADSITLDPHKGMFLPYGTGGLLVRDGEHLRAAHSVAGHYLQDLAHGSGLPDFADFSPELSRAFRGLRVWLPLQLHGVGAFRAALDEKLDLAAAVDAALRADGRIEVPWPTQLSIVAFRGLGLDDSGNRAFLERINASRRVYLSSTVVEGRFTLRVCVLSHRTHRDRVEEAIRIIREAVGTTA